MKAKIRHDLKEQGLKIPTLSGEYIPLNDDYSIEYEAWEPACLELCEFNTVLVNSKTKRTSLVNSIDVEFEE